MKFSQLIQKDRELLKGKSPKEKAKHIWLYYKWHLGAVLLLIIYVASTIYSNVSADDCILSGVFLNTTAPSYTVLSHGEEFLTAGPYATGSEVHFDTMYYSTSPDAEDAASVYETFQLLIAKAHAGELDILVTGSDTRNQLIYNEFFVDLNQVLTSEQIQAYEGRFLYMDKAFLAQLGDLSTTPVSYPDPTKPELMAEPIPVLVSLDGSTAIDALYCDSIDLYCLGFIVGIQHPEAARDYLDFLIK